MSAQASHTDHVPALQDIRVLELTDWIAGPFAAAVLGDFGAEVARIEMPKRLDHSRRMGEGTGSGDRSATFAAMARNKRSVCLDLQSSEGAALFNDLLAKSDVFITNIHTRRLRALGWPPSGLSDRFPNLVILAISGYGLTGPRMDLGAVDRVAQAFGGLTYVTGDPDRPPTRAGLPVADYAAGWVGAFGVLLALIERARSGRGQVVDLALYEPILSLLPALVSNYISDGTVAERTGNEVAAVAPGGTFRARDGRWVQISASSDSLFQRLMSAVGRSELGTTERLATVAQRHSSKDELMELISDWTGQRDATKVLDTLASHGVPCAAVNSIADLMVEPQLAARGNLVDIQDPDLGLIRAVAPMPRLSRTPGLARAPGPHHGADTREILSRWLGLGGPDIQQLERAGVVGSAIAGLQDSRPADK